MNKIKKTNKNKNNSKIKKNKIRYPNLNTILMIESYLKENKDMPLKITKIKENLPKQIMHETLKITLEYLYISGKIIYGPKGIQWIYKEPQIIKNMMENSLEI